MSACMLSALLQHLRQRTRGPSVDETSDAFWHCAHLLQNVARDRVVRSVDRDEQMLRSHSARTRVVDRVFDDELRRCREPKLQSLDTFAWTSELFDFRAQLGACDPERPQDALRSGRLATLRQPPKAKEQVARVDAAIARFDGFPFGQLEHPLRVTVEALIRPVRRCRI